MKRMFNLFAMPEEEQERAKTTYIFKNPRISPEAVQGRRSTEESASESHQAASNIVNKLAGDIPDDYAGLLEFFRRTVADRKSPYNALVLAADKLADYIPDEISRLKAAMAICGEKWSKEVLELAINSHIADIDHACTKVKSSKANHAQEHIHQLKEQGGFFIQKNVHLEEQILALRRQLARLEEEYRQNQATTASIEQRIQLIEHNAGSVAFVEQAAENLKNDLLAKKVLLGLT